MSLIRFVAIVPEQGSAYYLEPGGGLIQVPMLRDGTVTVPEPGTFKGGDEAEVDWHCAFEDDADAHSVRKVERALRAIPDDLTDSIAPYRFALHIALGGPEMQRAGEVANALRQAAAAIEAGDELKGNIYTASGDECVGRYIGCFPGEDPLPRMRR